MFRILKRLFSSPETLLNVISREDLQASEGNGERVLIDEDGNTSVNIHSKKVKEDFSRHIAALRMRSGPCPEKNKK